MVSLRVGRPTTIHAAGLVKSGKFRTIVLLVLSGAKYLTLSRSLKPNMRAAFTHCAEGVITAGLQLQ